MREHVRIVVVALVAGVLGVIAALAWQGPGPLWGSKAGQRALQSALDRTAPAPPADLAIAQVGQPVPSFSLLALDDTKPKQIPADFSGRPVLVNLWASWCAPCLQEMPELAAYATTQDANGVQVVGIALEDAASVRAFLAKHPVGYPILIDAPGARDAGVRLGNLHGVLPYTVLIDADGRLLARRAGPFAAGEIAPWVGEQLGRR